MNEDLNGRPGIFSLPHFPPVEGDEIKMKLPLGDYVGILSYFCWTLDTFYKALIEGGFT